MKLTAKQKLFCNEYLIDLNATQAAIRANYSVKTAIEQASRLLTKVNVQEYIQQRMKDREIRTEITQDKVLKELANIGFSNGSDFAKVVEKSYMKEIYNDAKEKIGEEEVFYTTVVTALTDSIDKSKLAAIAGIRSTKDGIEVKTNDKVKALELIGKHLGMFKDQIELNATFNKKLEDYIE